MQQIALAEVNRMRSERHTAAGEGIAHDETLRVSLAHALRKNELSVHYQPQMSLKKESATHVEALLRWHHPQLGFVPPATFIPLAEELGLIEELTSFVIHRVIHDVFNWRNEHATIGSVSVNISARVFSSRASAERLLNLLTSIVAFNKYLVLELTETAFIQNMELTQKYIRLLRDLGFRIALDDFGTGYSSMAYLLEFPIDIIKIDRCFVSILPKSPKSVAIVKSIISLARSLDLLVIAEGVETDDELRILQEMGCDYVQGYLYSRPLPMELIREFLANVRHTA